MTGEGDLEQRHTNVSGTREVGREEQSLGGIGDYLDLLPSEALKGMVEPKLNTLQQRLKEAGESNDPLFVLFLRVKRGRPQDMRLAQVKPPTLLLLKEKKLGYETPFINIPAPMQISCLPDETQFKRYQFSQFGRFSDTDPALNNCFPDGEGFTRRVETAFREGDGTMWSLIDERQMAETAEQNQEMGRHILTMRKMLAKAERGELTCWSGNYVLESEVG